MKNKISDLNNYLFEAIERLNDDDNTGDSLSMEIERAKAVSGVAKAIIENTKLALDIQKHFDEYGTGKNVVTPMIEGEC